MDRSMDEPCRCVSWSDVDGLFLDWFTILGCVHVLSNRCYPWIDYGMG